MKRFSILLILLLTLALAACGGASTGTGSGDSAATPKGPITVASKGFTEQFILGQMYAQLLEANGFEVDEQLGLGTTDIIHAAMLEGDVALYPEYTSTGLLTVLKAEPMSDRQAIYDKVKSEYETQFKITWLDAAPFNNTQALAVTRATSDELGLTKVSQLAALAPQLRVGGPPEFFEREDGLPGVKVTYGDMSFAEEVQVDPGLRYEALLNDEIDLVVAFGTDGQIGGYDLVVLEDDKSLWPPYQVAPVIRQDVLEKYPEIATILDPLAPLLDDTTMANLNWEVDGPDKKEPEEVAHEFLHEHGLIPEDEE